MTATLLSIALSAAAMTVIVGVRYLLSSGIFAWATEQRFPGRAALLRLQIGREIRWSLLSAAIYGIPAGCAAWAWQNLGWTAIYSDWTDYPLWYLPIAPLLYLMLHDSWFYWTHRLFHRPNWFRIAHAVHHDSRPPTAWAAMSFHPVEAISGAIVIPALVFLIPIHVAMLGLVLTIMTIMGVTNHMGWELFPRKIIHGPLGRALITASHHELHHQKYKGNYGLYFRFWDKICGTDLGLATWDSAPVDTIGDHGQSRARR